MKKLMSFVAMLCFSLPLFAADKNETLTIIVPFAAGGATTMVARMVSKYFEDNYNQLVVVENRALGGGGHGAAQVVANSKPDGRTMLLGTVGIHSSYYAFKKLPYNPATALKPIIILVEMPHVLVVNPKFPARNLKEYAEIAKTKQVTFGSSGGIGSSTHLTGEKFKMESGAKEMVHIPYRGSAFVMQDLLAGQIDSTFEQLPIMIQQIQAGNVRPLAITSAQRSPVLPNVPTVAEQGYPGFSALAWFTLSVPAGTPDGVILKLNKQLNVMLQDKEVQKSLQDLNLTPIGGSPNYATWWYQKESKKWKQVIDFYEISTEL